MNAPLGELTEIVAQQGATLVAIREQVAKVIVGQTNLVDRLLIALLARGHLLVEGVPGLAKTRTVNALAQALALDFRDPRLDSALSSLIAPLKSPPA